MCYIAVIAAAVAVVASIASNISANKQMRKQEKAINRQNAIRQKEISKQAGQELTQRARAARRERGAARAAAGAAGVNLDSNSFLAMLTTSEVNQVNDSGTILFNERSAQSARDAQYRSALSQIQYKNGLGIALDAAQAGFSAYMGFGGMPSGGATSNPGVKSGMNYYDPGVKTSFSKSG